MSDEGNWPERWAIDAQGNSCRVSSAWKQISELPFSWLTPAMSRKVHTFMGMRHEPLNFWDGCGDCLDRPHFHPAGSCIAWGHEGRDYSGSSTWVYLP